MPKISVIIPIYGVEKYIERCAQSLFEQTLEDMEFIFVDDCTPDKSVEVLEKVINRYPSRKNQISIIHHEINKGLPVARKSGLLVAEGEYIAHCDSDDWVDRDLYQKMYTIASNGYHDIVCCDIKITNCTTSNIVHAGYKINPKECIIEMMHRRMWWNLWNKIIKRSLYNNSLIYPSDAMGEDMCLCLQIMKNVKRIGYMKGSYYNYYINPNSIVNSMSKELCVNKHTQLTKNIEIVKQSYKDISDKRIRQGLVYLTFYTQEMLMPIIKKDKEIRTIWENNLKGYCLPVVFNNNAKLKQRLKALLLWLHLFPLK